MRGRFGILAASFLTVAPGGPLTHVTAQEPVPERPTGTDTLERVIGEVAATNPATRQITLNLDAGGTVLVILQDKTLYLRVPPGETDLKKATKIVPTDIGVGDRVYARGRFAEDRKSIPALAVIVMTKADLAQKRERERADWQKGAIGGTIRALKPDTQEISVSVRSRDGARAVIIEPSRDTVFRRYAADSVQFHQAQPSSFAELKVGDSLRILGEKSPDGTRIKPKEIVSGSFRNIPGLITAIDAVSREIRITDLQSKRAVTVRITADTVVRRMPAMKPAAGPGRPLQAGTGAAAARAGAGSEGRTSQAPQQSAPAPPSGQPGREANRGTPGSGVAGSGSPPARTASPAVSSMDVERMPPVKFEDLKTGDAIIVLCTVGAEPSRVTAIVTLAGVEALLAQAPEGPPQIGGAWDFFDINLP